MQNFKLTADYLSQKRTFIAYLNSNAVGWYSFSVLPEAQLELDNFFIHPDYIGQGLGHAMWKKCTITAKDYNLPFFILWSDPNAEGFYQKMGCIKIGRRKSPMMPNRYPCIFRYDLK